MGMFKQWLENYRRIVNMGQEEIEHLGKFCKYCGHEVDDNGNAKENVLHPPGLSGPSLEKYIEKYGYNRIYPVVCRNCYEQMNNRKYPIKKAG